jgi:hypothetical protein
MRSDFRLLSTIGIVALVLANLPPASARDRHPDGDAVAQRMVTSASHLDGGHRKARNDRFRVLGHSDLGGGGLNADVWAHKKYAYVGVWSGTCPATGVKVADYHNLRQPQVVSVLPNDAGTSAEDIVVRHVETPSFTGDLAVTGIQVCGDVDEPVFRGLAFFDVTDPRHPVELGRWTAPEFSVGCHEVDLVQRLDGQVLAGCANVFAEQINGTDEIVLVDATDPTTPTTAGGWAIGADLGIDPADNPENLGCFPASFDHSVRFIDNGMALYGSYWDFGAVRLDIGDPLNPAYVGRADIAPPDEDGDVHSVVASRDGGTLLVNPEDFSPVDCPGEPALDGWGEVHLFDVSDASAPDHLGTFSTPNSRSTRDDGFYSVHNTEIAKGTQAFSSWYSDGIVWWDFDDPTDPTQRGQWVPPAAEDPTGTFPTIPIVWGVYLDRQRNVVLASDINSGLWILRPTALGNF